MTRKARLVGQIYWVLLGVALALCVLPLWLSAMPFLTDFGGHFEMVDAWARLDESPFLTAVYQRREGWLLPNLLAAHFVGLLYPATSTLAGLRIFVSLSLVLLAGSLWFCLRVYDRSQWLVFLCLPVFWGGALTLGLINFVACFPLMFFGMGLGRLCGSRGGVRYGVALLAVTTTAFFVHGIGYLLVLMFSGFALVTSAVHWRRLGALLWMLPSASLWIRWRVRAGQGPWTGNATYFSWGDNVDWFLREASNPLSAAWDDTILLWMLAPIWIVLVVVGARSWAEPAGVQRRISDHGPLLLGMLFLISFVVLPAYYGGVSINTRLVTPTLLCLLIGAPLSSKLPRTGWPRWASRIALGSAVVLSLAASSVLILETRRFQSSELEPLLSVIDHIPSESLATCTGVNEARPIFLRLPLDHNCDALLQLQTGGFAGGGFAKTAFNAIKLKGNIRDRKLYGDLELVKDWEYVVMRGEHRPPTTVKSIRVAQVDQWTLYRIEEPAVPESIQELRRPTP